MADDVYINTLLEECGVLMSPHFPGMVQPGLWSWVLQAPQDTHFIIYVYYVIGPAIVSENSLCEQYFAGWLWFLQQVSSVQNDTSGSHLKVAQCCETTLRLNQQCAMPLWMSSSIKSVFNALSVIEISRDALTLRQYEANLLKVCEDTGVFVPPKRVKVSELF